MPGDERPDSMSLAISRIASFTGALPPILWDGLSESEDNPALLATPVVAGWSLNLSRQGQSLAEAQPGPLDVPAYGQPWEFGEIGAPEELEERLGG